MSMGDAGGRLKATRKEGHFHASDFESGCSRHLLWRPRKVITGCCKNGSDHHNSRVGMMVGMMTLRPWVGCLCMNFLETLQKENDMLRV